MNKKSSYFNLDVTLEEAVKSFGSLEPGLVAKRAQVNFMEADSSFSLTFINRGYRVSYPSGEVANEDGSPASTYLAIIILHYLVTADGTPLTGNWIAYRHLPGGDIYIDPFKKRAITPFLKTFGEKPEEFRKAAGALGGYELTVSGISMVIPVLPRVPICFVLWPGDEEMPASANILFDEAAPSYLPTEDYAHLPAIVTGAIKEELQKS